MDIVWHCKLCANHDKNHVVKIVITWSDAKQKHWTGLFVTYSLGHSINGLVTDGITKICSRGSILALFQSTTDNKLESE